MERITGYITEVRYHNPRACFVVLALLLDGSLFQIDASGRLEPPFAIGSHVACEGVWQEDDFHGPQFVLHRIVVA